MQLPSERVRQNIDDFIAKMPLRECQGYSVQGHFNYAMDAVLQEDDTILYEVYSEDTFNNHEVEVLCSTRSYNEASKCFYDYTGETPA